MKVFMFNEVHMGNLKVHVWIRYLQQCIIS